MKRMKCIQEIHEVKLPIGLLRHDEFLELADPEVGDRIMTVDGSLRSIRYPFECVGKALVVVKREQPE